MESMEALDNELRKEDMQNIYLFCSGAAKAEARKWTKELADAGHVVEYLTDNFLADIKLIITLVRKHSVAIVHTHFVNTKQFVTTISAVNYINRAKKLKKGNDGSNKVVIIRHMHNHSVSTGNPVKKLLRIKLYKKVTTISCSESVHRSVVRDYTENKKYYVNNGVNFNRLEKYSRVAPEEYGIPADEKVLLIFGFDFYRKGVDRALKAIDDLRKKGHKYSLLISLSTNFEYVEEQVRIILGELPEWVHIIKARNDVATLYNYSEIFLSPSREEGLPYSVVEAAYCRCSVVMSDISAQKNLKLKYGYWFKNESIEGLEEAILKADTEHESKLENMAEVKQYIMDNYSLAQWAEGILKVYHEVLQ